MWWDATWWARSRSRLGAFGLAIGLISCYKGFNCGKGAAGVGRAATDSFVTSFVAIIIINFFLAKFLKDLYIFLYGPTAVNAFTS